MKISSEEAEAMWVYVTCESESQAHDIGMQVLKERLAACANIIPGMRSMYWWEGKLEEARESVLIFKTTTDSFAQLSERIKALHSYDVPCVIGLPIMGGNADYLSWIHKETISNPNR